MLKIRFQRAGSKKKPYYRLVVIPSTSSTTSKVIERLGTYSPLNSSKIFYGNNERIEYWLAQGAQLTRSARSFIQNNKEEMKGEKNNTAHGQE